MWFFHKLFSYFSINHLVTHLFSHSYIFVFILDYNSFSFYVGTSFRLYLVPIFQTSSYYFCHQWKCNFISWHEDSDSPLMLTLTLQCQATLKNTLKQPASLANKLGCTVESKGGNKDQVMKYSVSCSCTAIKTVISFINSWSFMWVKCLLNQNFSCLLLWLFFKDNKKKIISARGKSLFMWSLLNCSITNSTTSSWIIQIVIVKVMKDFMAYCLGRAASCRAESSVWWELEWRVWLQFQSQGGSDEIRETQKSL